MPLRCKLIGGTPLLGFASHFDSAWGMPSDGPMPTITPSAIAGVLLPFPCPHCGAVRPKAVDPRTRCDYADRDRGFSWCPACQGRYVVNFKGQPLPEALPAGATFAPALVERGGKVEALPAPERARAT